VDQAIRKPELTYALKDVQTIHDSTKHHVLAVTLRGRGQSDEELTAVCVLSRICHAEDARGMLQLQPCLLIIELAAIYAVAARTIACSQCTCDWDRTHMHCSLLN
jgi:hypothetical protein